MTGLSTPWKLTWYWACPRWSSSLTERGRQGKKRERERARTLSYPLLYVRTLFLRRSAAKLKMEEASSPRWWFQEKSLVLSTAAAPAYRLYGGDGVRTPGASRRLQGASAEAG